MARSHLDSMSLLGITERLDLLYRLFEVHFGLKLSGPPHLNRSESLNVDLVTPRARELIVAHNQYDIKLYEYAQHLIRERAAAAGIKDSSDSVAVDRSPVERGNR